MINLITLNLVPRNRIILTNTSILKSSPLEQLSRSPYFMFVFFFFPAISAESIFFISLAVDTQRTHGNIAYSVLRNWAAKMFAHLVFHSFVLSLAKVLFLERNLRLKSILS